MSTLEGDGKWSVERQSSHDVLIQMNFWQYMRDCSDNERSMDWVSGDFCFMIGGLKTSNIIIYGEIAFGVQFDRNGLPVDLDSQAGAAKGGRPAKWNWTEAVNAVWSQIYVGDIKPTSQAVIEQAILYYLSKDDVEPSESAVRNYARMIWKEARPEGKKPQG